MEKIEQITTDCKQSVKTYTLIQKNIEDNLVDILQNCINNSDGESDKKKTNNRYGKLTKRTVASRPRYAARIKHQEEVIKGVIKNLRLLEQGKCVSQEQQRYAEQLKKITVQIVAELILKEGRVKDNKTNPEECDEAVLEKWNHVIQELQGKKEWSKILDLRKVYDRINGEFFWNYEITHCNHYWSYFQYPDSLFSSGEDNDEILNDSVNELSVCRPITDFIKTISWSIDKIGYRENWLLFYYEQAVTQYDEAEKWYQNEIKKYKEENKGVRGDNEQHGSDSPVALYKEIAINFYIENYCSTYTQYALDDVEAKCRDDEYFGNFLDAFMICTAVKTFGSAGAYIWGGLNWFGEKNISRDEKCKEYLSKRWVDGIIYSREVMKQRILFSLMERLTEDAITLSENGNPVTSADSKYLDIGTELVTDRVEDVLRNMREIHFAKLKQADAQARWSVYKYERACVDKLLEGANDNNFSSYALFLRESDSVKKNQYFHSIINHFFKNDERDSNDAIYVCCLNQFIFLDSAVELAYEISRLTKIKIDTHTYLKTKIMELANVLVKLQHNLKCGVGKIIHTYFEKVLEIDGQLDMAQMNEWLTNFKDAIEKNLLNYDVTWIDDDLYKEVRQNSWEKLKEINPSYEGGFPDNQIFVLAEERSRTDWEFVYQYEEAVSKRKHYVKILTDTIAHEKLDEKMNGSPSDYGAKERILKAIKKLESESVMKENGQPAKESETETKNLFTVTFQWALSEWYDAYCFASSDTGKGGETTRIKKYIREQIIVPMDEMIATEYNSNRNGIYKDISLGDLKRAVYKNIVCSCNGIVHEKDGKALRDKIKKQIDNEIYDKNLVKIQKSLREGNKTFWDYLMISKEAREFAEKYLLEEGDHRGKRIYLYGEIQNALINSNYRYNKSMKEK